MSDSLWPHHLQHVRLLCPSLSPRVSSNSCALSQVILFSHLILFHPLLLLPSIFPSIKVFWVSSLHQVAKVLELQLQQQSFHWIFRVDLLAVQGTLMSLLQHDNSKSSILQHLAFFMVQFSHAHMTTGKTITLTLWTFVDKMRSLLYCCLFIVVYVDQSFSSKEQTSFNFIAAINICSGFWSPGK